MNTLICRTCGCSLVRLGVSNDQADTDNHDGEEYPIKWYKQGIHAGRGQ